MTPIQRRKRRPSADIVAAILQAAAEAFERFGYAGATTAAIARAADVTEAQLFRHFPTKAELFRESIFKPLDQHFSDFQSRHVEDAGKAGDRALVARDYIMELRGLIGDHSRMLMSMIVAQTYASTGAATDEIESLNAYFDRGAAMMARRVGNQARVDPRLMVRVSFAAVLACVAFKDWVFPPGLANEEDIAAAITEFVMDGINANGAATSPSIRKPL